MNCKETMNHTPYGLSCTRIQFRGSCKVERNGKTRALASFLPTNFVSGVRVCVCVLCERVLVLFFSLSLKSRAYDFNLIGIEILNLLCVCVHVTFGSCRI